jgi:hypothetical protein
MHEPAIAEVRKGFQLWQGAPMFLAWLGEAYAAGGYSDDAQKILEQLEQISKQRYVSPYHMGPNLRCAGQQRRSPSLAGNWLPGTDCMDGSTEG